MCDHCAKVSGQKGYSGQVTCRCDGNGKKEMPKEKGNGGCCGGKKERKPDDDEAKCCAGMRVEAALGCGGNTKVDKPREEKKSCCKRSG